jgi:hypothetical protein
LPVTINSTVFDEKLDDELLSQREIEEQWEDLVVAGPITINYIGNLMVLASTNDFALVPPKPNHVWSHTLKDGRNLCGRGRGAFETQPTTKCQK